MKKLIIITLVVGALAALLAGTVWAAGPITPFAQGFGPGMGFRAQGATGQFTSTENCPVCGTATGSTGGMMGAGGMMGRGAPEWAGDMTEVATLLGMTDDELHAERLAGRSLAQIAASKGISAERLIGAIIDAKKADLAKLVADGKLTQAQADGMIQNMQAQVKAMVERANVGPAASQGQARPGMGRNWDQSGTDSGRAPSGGMMGRGSQGGRGGNR